MDEELIVKTEKESNKNTIKIAKKLQERFLELQKLYPLHNHFTINKIAELLDNIALQLERG